LASNKVKVQVLKSGQLVITIPKAIADFKGWKKGTELEWKEDRFGTVTLKETGDTR
jgi:bifunctional DNA-binding transcriptional regulator/antitoxin component of YhaV-PrlF toxin-antitoxin module